MGNQVGGAFVVYYNNQEIYHSCFRLSNHASVYLAELTAISTALDYVAVNNISQANIISDARSVLLALENPNNLEPHTVALKHKLVNLSGKIQLYWIKAHVGFAGNEKADEYAKQATTQQSIDIATSINIHVVKNLIKRELMVNWQHRWDSSTKGRSVYSLFPKVSTNRVQGDFFLNQLITGHGALAIYQQRFFGKTANCRCGHPIEDIHHIIYVCPLWDSIREKFFPRNFQSVKRELLLFNSISKTGLKEIMCNKLQTPLQELEDEGDVLGGGLVPLWLGRHGCPVSAARFLGVLGGVAVVAWLISFACLSACRYTY
ncbi:RNase H domain-containing protein [Caerostris darwini]|uniref:RNase H domain-containing protein n=1 Tax=Caerostris darwini TaxID=1538125 RepID=A0AAV4NS81_9ARAC|nr:RNase H domain-containing protein [Caerostris darwini]